MNYAEYYYEYHYGNYPFDEDKTKLIRTQKTIDYLFEADFTSKEIIQIIEQSPKKESLTYEDLPDYLWNNSLLSKNTFYHHNQLQILSTPAKFDPITNQFKSSNFFIEMKIKYTEKDMLNYFYNTFKIDSVFINENKDLGALKYLLKKYSKIEFMASVDFILFLIDYAKLNYPYVSSLFDIDEKCSLETYKLMKIRIPQQQHKIIFR